MTTQPNQPEDSPLDEHHIPLEPLPERPAKAASNPPAAQESGPRSRIDRPSLMSGELSACPGCGAALAKDSVVCTACGLDLRIGQRREVEVGEVESPESGVKPEYLKPGRVSPKALAAAGIACAIGAAVLAGVNAPRGSTAVTIGLVLKTIYDTLVHTGTGIVALVIAAIFAGARISRYDVAAARMFLAFAVFQLVSQVRLPGVAGWISGLLFFVLAGVMYFLLLMALLKKSKEQVITIGALHAGLWLLFEGGFQLAKWLGGELEHLPRV